MSATAERRAAAMSRRAARSGSDFVSLASPVLELIMKVQAGLVAPSNELRPTVAGLLAEMEERALKLRLSEKQTRSVKFALAAFMDETVLTNDFPLREEWEKFPLQLEYFGEHLAGVKFFERLDDLLRSIETEADVVEVYYVCMLLGYKGKYKIYLEEQLKGVIENTADHLRRVGRLQEGELSPHWRVTDQPEPPRDKGLPLWAIISAGAGLALAIIIYLALNFVLTKNLNEAIDQLLR
ncbi:MAG: type IVB secretion system protein IcmH/DotU [Acidobacteria bacterium]|nr:type IVB secretion system protein IcmH/DotU [Acidobacteriota bacterium]